MEFTKKNIAIVTIAILLSIAFIVFLDIINYECIYRKLFNLYCPGCGMTRMLKSLFSLDFYQAFRYNPLMFIIFVFVLPVYLILNIISYIKKKKFIKITKAEIIIFILIMLIYFVLRNLEIGEYLIPTKV